MFLAHKNDLVSGMISPLPQFSNHKFLMNDAEELKIGNNICPHQASLITTETQHRLQCQYHGWEWDFNGKPISQGFSKLCNTKKLTLKSAFQTNGLIFDKEIDLSSYPSLYNFTLVEKRIDTVKTISSNIMDVFLDVDHIPLVHEHVYDAIGIDGSANVDWEYFNWGSSQTVTNATGETIAVWIAVYPYTMIEWQQGALFITVSVPDEKETNAVVFKYKENSSDSDFWQMNEKIWETAWAQDKHQAESIVKFAEYKNLEQSKKHFRIWLKDNGIYSK